MTIRHISTLLLALPFSACVPAGPANVREDLGSVPVQGEGETVALSGGLTFDDVTAFGVAHHQVDGTCSKPGLAWLEVGYGAPYPRLEVQLPFETTPAGTFAIGSYLTGTSGKESTRWDVQAGVATKEGTFVATSGQIAVAVDGTIGEARLEFTDLFFDGYDTAYHSGSATLDLVVACKPVTQESDGVCVWEVESPPYESAYCSTTMAGYAPDVLL